MLRICHIASGDLWAGAEVQVATLLAQLRGRPEIQLSFVVLNEGILAETARQHGIDTLVLPESKLGFWRLVYHLTLFLRRERPHLIHSHRYKENILAAIAGRFAGAKYFVRTQHGYHELSTERQPARQHLVNEIDRMIGRHLSSRVIAVSRDLAAKIEPLYGANVQVISNGVDRSRLPTDLTASAAKARLGFAPETPVIAFVGRLEPVKRPDLFVATAALIISQRPSAQFIVMGDGKQRTAVDEQIKSVRLEKHVCLLGHRLDVLELLRASDVLLITSDHEGLPMVLLEALALGTVVVSRSVGGICEVIDTGRNGVLVDSHSANELAEAVIAVLSMNTEDRLRLLAAARSTVETSYSSEQNAEQIVDLYSSLLERS
jgi:L-malate glycosyltransferase